MSRANHPGDMTVILQPEQPLATELPVPRLEISVTREAGVACHRTMTLQGDRIRVGSHQSNEVTLLDRSVSRFHFSLIANQHGWALSDTSSRNGTFLAGARIREVDLPRPTCELTLGESRIELRELGASTLALIPACSNLGELYGRSVVMRRLYATLNRVASSEATVLVEGESGTGKELVAHEIVH
ncbi:MAG TPA: FHA domain-containing protein, partial [Polyangiaceae bacterium]